MARTSAGLLLHRAGAGGVEVLLVHPGGPFWAKKDEGAWSIPKGEHEPDDDPQACALREFEDAGSDEVASGLLAGRYNDGMPDDSRLAQAGYEWLRETVLGSGRERVERVRHLAPIAQELGVSQAQLALAWCLANPHVSTVLLGASRREQLEQNLAALELVPRIDAALKQRIEQAVG